MKIAKSYISLIVLVAAIITTGCSTQEDSPLNNSTNTTLRVGDVQATTDILSTDASAKVTEINNQVEEINELTQTIITTSEQMLQAYANRSIGEGGTFEGLQAEVTAMHTTMRTLAVGVQGNMSDVQAEIVEAYGTRQDEAAAKVSQMDELAAEINGLGAIQNPTEQESIQLAAHKATYEALQLEVAAIHSEMSALQSVHIDIATAMKNIADQRSAAIASFISIMENAGEANKAAGGIYSPSYTSQVISNMKTSYNTLNDASIALTEKIATISAATIADGKAQNLNTTFLNFINETTVAGTYKLAVLHVSFAM